MDINYIKKFIFDLADWIYRRKCYFCGISKENVKMCSKCLNSIEYNNFEENREILNTKIYCATQYSNIVQKLVRGVKYHKQKDLAFYQAKIMFNYWQNLNVSKEFQIVPVPLFYKREKSRNYNHMKIVGDEFAKLTGYILNNDLIKRTKNTKPQYKLSRKERMANLENAFSVDKSKFIKGKSILILDDICTTGSTFESMIKELNKNEMYDITCFA